MQPDTQSQRIGKAMIFIAWIVFLLLLAMFFQRWLENKNNPNQIVTSHIGKNGVREVVLTRNAYGHYVATGLINEHPVVFLVDTGATDVAIPAKLADVLGLTYGYAVSSVTAAGTVTAYQTQVDLVALGDIQLRNISASILPKMGKDTVLLGMSFLKDLEIIQKGDKLTIRQFP